MYSSSVIMNFSYYKMQREKIKEEATSSCSLSMMASPGSSYHHNTPNLSLDDFEGNIYPAVTLPLFVCLNVSDGER